MIAVVVTFKTSLVYEFPTWTKLSTTYLFGDLLLLCDKSLVWYAGFPCTKKNTMATLLNWTATLICDPNSKCGITILGPCLLPVSLSHVLYQHILILNICILKQIAKHNMCACVRACVAEMCCLDTFYEVHLKMRTTNIFVLILKVSFLEIFLIVKILHIILSLTL